MAESKLHRFLKAVAMETLMREGYRPYMEPKWSPLESLSWGRYRPDVLGVRSSRNADEYAFVECETKPEPKRIVLKQTTSISIQAKLLRETSQKLILAIPYGRSDKLKSGKLAGWEVWQINGKGMIERDSENGVFAW